MKNKKRSKLLVILMLIITLVSTFSQSVLAISKLNESSLFSKGDCGNHLQFNDNGSWSYVTTSFVVYNENGKEYPAYCLNRELPGAEAYGGGYTVDITGMLDDYRVWRTIINGYPYKTPAEMGVANEYDAFVATKHAVYSILYDRDVRTFYRGGDTRGEQIVNAMERMVNEGRYGAYTPIDPNISATKSGEVYEEGEYYVQKYDIQSSTDIKAYHITATANLPSGTLITDIYGTSKTSFVEKESFLVKIPEVSFDSNINAIVNLQGECKTYPVFYGQTRINGTQNYAVAFDPYGDGVGRANLDIATNTGRIEINKVDKETNNPIQGALFEVSKENGEIIGEFTTDNEGKIIVSNLYQGNYVIKETASADGYIFEDIQENVSVEFNKTTSITISNQHKKGNLKITKIDFDDNDLTLGAVEFDLLDSNGDFIQKLITDVDGEIYLENINTGTYILRETKTKKEYEIGIDVNSTVNWNETTEITITNEKMKGQVRIIKVDKDNNEVKLPNVTFEIYNSKDELVETLITDQNGVAITSRLPIGEYKIKETITQENYVLNEEVKTITLERNQITDIQFENEKIKGQIEILKIAKDNNSLTGDLQGATLERATYEIYDEQDILVDTITTGEDGKSISKLLEKGIYAIKEKLAPEYYLIDQNEYEIEITSNKEIIQITLENESVDIDVDVLKKGIKETQSNEIIYYDFENIKNNSNVELDNFIWRDVLPTEAIRITKMNTGTWNQELSYDIWYKTNLNDYTAFKTDLDSAINHEINFEEVDLEGDEYITEFEFRFETVKIDFGEVEKPKVYCIVLDELENGAIFKNETFVSGNYKEKYVEDKDEYTTIVYEKEEIVDKTLPKTGF